MSKLRKTLKAAGLIAAAGALAFGAAYALAPEYEGGAGIDYGKAYAPIRDEAVKFHMWYPASGGGRAVTVGGNGVFYGTPAGRGAERREGKFPLVLISHGSGGNAGQFGWIAKELAQAGFVVILPNHPGTTTGNASAEAAMRLWERPQDISAILDAIEAAPEDYPFIDMSRIAALGFSAGGYTAMALGGARLVPEQLNAFCDEDTGMSDCEFFRLQGVDLREVDFGPAAQDLRDPRVKAGVIIDPGTAPALDEASLAAMDMPTLLLNLGAEGEIPPGVNGARAAGLMQDVTYEHIEGAWHFSFLAECKDRGAKILRDEGELDALCDEVSDRRRADIHAELKGRVIGYLKARL